MGADPPDEQASIASYSDGAWSDEVWRAHSEVLEEIGEEIAALEETVDVDGLPESHEWESDELSADQLADVLVTRLKLLVAHLEADDDGAPRAPWYQ